MPHQTRRGILGSAIALPTLIAAARANAAARHAGTTLLQNTMAHGRFVAYQPTALKAFNGKLTHADDASIRADLEVLRPWFDGLITYGAHNGNERVPDVASSLGYRAVVMGVWDPSDSNEIANALAAWKRNPSIVAGVSLGNEIVFGKRGRWSDLLKSLHVVRAQAPGLPLTVSEPFAQYLDDYADAKPVLHATDFMLVNIHPVYEPWFKSGTADNWTDFVVRVMARLAAVYPRPVLVKETGVPTGPASAGFSADAQRDFYRLLAQRLPPSKKRAFAYFTAFDEPWRTGDFNPMPGPHPEEAYWGLFSETRQPKPVMTDLAKLAARNGD
jgi:exo-beta-1,3-glucanase (GH17 family)